MNKNNIVLNKVFTQSLFDQLLNNRQSEHYKNSILNYIGELETYDSNKNIIKELYNYIKKEYRNEYFYKNTLFNKLLLGKHSLKTTTALNELQISQSKADFILINGKAVVYEIKTELDNFDRLDSQISDYYKAFNHVCVVTCESNYKKISKILSDTNVGINILTKRNTVSIRRKPIEDNSKLDYETIFKILRKGEFEEILLKVYGNLPLATPVNYYKECFKLFEIIPKDLLYKYFLIELKKRSNVNIEFFRDNVPYELKFLIYFSGYKSLEYDKLSKFLEKVYGG